MHYLHYRKGPRKLRSNNDGVYIRGGRTDGKCPVTDLVKVSTAMGGPHINLEGLLLLPPAPVNSPCVNSTHDALAKPVDTVSEMFLHEGVVVTDPVLGKASWVEVLSENVLGHLCLWRQLSFIKAALKRN